MVEPTTTVATAAVTAEAAGGLTATKAVTGSELSAFLQNAVERVGQDTLQVALDDTAQEVLRDSPELQNLASIAVRAGVVELESAEVTPDLSGKVDWAQWLVGPDETSALFPDELSARFSAVTDSRASIESYLDHKLTTDGKLRDEFARRARAYADAHGLAAKDTALLQVRQSTVSALTETLVEDAFKPFGASVSTQVRENVGTSYTKLDLKVNDAKRPLVLGRGASVQPGEAFAVEVKCGKAGYLRQELPHLTETQLPGHTTAADKSVLVVSKDIYDLSSERQWRTDIAKVGTKSLALLPRKELFDAICIDRVKEMAREL